MQDYAGREGYFTDCYAIDLGQNVSFSDYIAAFYSTKLFKLERFILRIFARAPATDEGARKLGLDEVDTFAVWRVSERRENQLLMETKGRTMSWFMVEDINEHGAPKSRLFFGSVVAPIKGKGSNSPRMGLLFSALLGMHSLYSKALLTAARARLLKAAQEIN